MTSRVNLLPVAHIKSFQDFSPRGPLVDITSNYLLYAPTSRGQKRSKDFLAYTPLFPTSRGTGFVQNLHLLQYPLNLQSDERVAAFQLDESQGLLAMIISNTSQHVAVLQFLGFPRAGFHHLTTAPQTGIFLHFEDIDTCQVQIHKDNIGVLICGETNSLTVYDWKTGRTRAQYAPIGRESITAFSFLTPNAIVTTNLSTLQIELWILTDSKMFQTGSLGLPAIRPGIAVEGLDCTPLSPDQLLDPQFSPVITFNLLMCKDTPRGSTSYCLVKFVVNTATLFDLGFSNVGPSKRGFKRHFPWAVWGPQATRCFDGSCAVDDCNRGGQYFVSLSDAECTEPYKLSIYDFGRAESLRNVQKLEPRFNCQELQHISVFQEDVYTLMPRSLLLYQVVAPSDRILVDRDRVFAFKYRHEDDHPSITLYYF